jgi:hypothetical protein
MNSQNVRRIKISGAAARYIKLLQDYGHLDAEGVNRLMLGLSELCDPDSDAPVSVATARRAAALMLFPEREGEPSVILQEDWTILFG